MVDGIGLCVRSVDVTARQASIVAQKAESLGFESFWVTEEMSRSSPPMIALAAYSTERIKLGTAIVSIYSRTPMATAMMAATLQELSDNRFILGLGSGGPEITRRGHGLDPAKPTERMEEYIKLVRSFLSGDRVALKGLFYKVDDVRLWVKVQQPPPVFLAALNPRMLTLAGMMADGVILNLFDPNAAGYVSRWLDEGLRRAGRTSQAVKRYSFVLAAASSSQDSVTALKKSIAFYVLAPTYQRILAEAGHGHVVERVLRSFENGGRDAAAESIPNELVEGVAILCDTPISQKLEEYRRVGVTPLIYPQPRRGKELTDILNIMEQVARQCSLY
ncbi:MAG: LLM class flavin-dependent oxidoreductase [Candidatus Caldarchaeum sp.]|uniref:LLM class flavin-dependent oxidoreductase n=1 Tax=Caldiarchaeum subterraneum TaxID=311458 RepID=A0A7C5QB00_CALS0